MSELAPEKTTNRRGDQLSAPDGIDSDHLMAPTPAWVIGEENRRRWDICRRIAETVSAGFEPDGVADSAMVWSMTRSIYQSELPTGDPQDVEKYLSQLQEAAEALPAAHEEETARLDRVAADWEQSQGAMPGPGATDDDYWRSIDGMMDTLDRLFGSPDDYDFGEYEGKVTSGGDPAELHEAFEHVLHGPHVPYNRALHPKDRLGRWSAKLHAMRAHIAGNREALKQKLAAHLAAARLHHEVAQAHRKGGALAHEGKNFHAAHARGDKTDAARLGAHAAEERARHGLSGAKRAAMQSKRRTHGEALAALAYVYSEKTEHKLGPLHEPFRDAFAAAEAKDKVETMHEIAKKATEYAVENRHEIHHVLRTAARVGHHVARAKGLAAADDDPEPNDQDVQLAEYALATVASEEMHL